MNVTAEDRARIEQESLSWPRLPAGRKVHCPDCGGSGYPGARWTHKHLVHTTCECGRVVPASSYQQHRNHRRHPR